MSKQIKKPVLMIVAVIICLAMVRLGFWQLDRATQKREILSQSITLSELPSINLTNLLNDFATNTEELRFRQVHTTGHYLESDSIFIDNQVLESKVGYSLLTPLQLSNSQRVIMVVRGWLAVGDSREVLPEFNTPVGPQTLQGRLNLLPAKPPLWNDEYAVSEGPVWQFLEIEQFRSQTGLDVLPMVIELAPVSDDEKPVSDDEKPVSDDEKAASENVESATTPPFRHWQLIDDKWVHKHQAYAVQWFAMAFAFFVVCIIVLINSLRKQANEQEEA